MAQGQVLRKELLVVLIGSVLSSGAEFTSSIGDKDITFYHVQSPDFGPVRLGAGRYERSFLSCVIMCLNKFHDCYSVMYNSSTHLCTPGGTSGNTYVPPASWEGQLYKRIVCDIGSGEFKIVVRGNEAMCIGVFVDWVNYATADASCKEKDSYLMPVGSIDQLAILENISYAIGDSFWLGCNDIQLEGTFVWTDNGQAVTYDELINYFRAGQPDDYNGDEDCCQYAWGTTKLNDIPCQDEMPYVCEKLWI